MSIFRLTTASPTGPPARAGATKKQGKVKSRATRAEQEHHKEQESAALGQGEVQHSVTRSNMPSTPYAGVCAFVSGARDRRARTAYCVREVSMQSYIIYQFAQIRRRIRVTSFFFCYVPTAAAKEEEAEVQVVGGGAGHGNLVARVAAVFRK